MKFNIKVVVALVALSCCVNLFGQNETVMTPSTPQAPAVKYEAVFEGMLGLSYGSNTVGINVGGPSLKYKFTSKFKIGVGAFPSLIIIDQKAMPRLAVSPIIEYNKWMVITPYYGYDAKDRQIWTFGLGYKFL